MDQGVWTRACGPGRVDQGVWTRAELALANIETDRSSMLIGMPGAAASTTPWASSTPSNSPAAPTLPTSPDDEAIEIRSPAESLPKPPDVK